mmetsp:Transcript_88340/g.205531  ORF Transcript_88340/g.205531 Transcript_88340/m.205531 type:complete len:249 (+) Transcript_88340:551-1297(+)
MRILHYHGAENPIQLPHELSSAELVQHATQRPDVRRLSVLRRGEHLRRHVAVCACMRQCGRPQSDTTCAPAEPKVTKAHAAVVCQEDILRLQVAVYHILAVQVLDCLQQLGEDSAHPLLREISKVQLNLFLEVALRAVFHDDDEVRLGFQGAILAVYKVVLVRDDVPVPQGHKLLSFATVFVHLGDLTDQDLLGHKASTIGEPLHQIHRAVSASTQKVQCAVLIAADTTGTAPASADLPEVDSTKDTQ